ncbi:protein kinase [Leptospira sp. 2 VSF19]|uniref:Protein kinase n=1 Tax=Leptospira soteropolitanensis TaxID=2950025 RepID=A0AAW5VRW1_9LEPT|nr:protein kinase [Leptospira soteropolitanensis]MCW7494843.1 protein kinase [Leptospira soteropolitanensis]MCW7502421.1 protein kinase [Leptospira soteropolitanensis]MCW7524663.1 protein kinase [Leptospira soteropolitanensis]MCW7528533.1 protein kinase [Leptospira soteropolitanensis]MCW7532391.1 protein kinase [Leptospira soteropolitanensis]
MHNLSNNYSDTFEDGSLLIAEKRFNIPGYRIIEQIGRGANATVFKAFDEKLKREVAIKVWNKHGDKRALEETIKIASLNHPLVINTYNFDMINNHPYSIMEIIYGQNGKNWLKEHQSIEKRLEIWKLYSKSLNYIYSKDMIHGDPHLGNILIFNDVENIYNYNQYKLSLKLADTGTSKFFTTKKKTLKRERKIIIETAERLFEDQRINLLWFLPDNLDHKIILSILDNIIQFIYTLNCLIDYDRKAEISDRIVNILLETPLFNLDEVLNQIKQNEFPPTERIIRKLNFKLYNMNFDQLMEAKTTIDEDSKLIYQRRKEDFISKLKQKK